MNKWINTQRCSSPLWSQVFTYTVTRWHPIPKHEILTGNQVTRFKYLQSWFQSQLRPFTFRNVFKTFTFCLSPFLWLQLRRYIINSRLKLFILLSPVLLISKRGLIYFFAAFKGVSQWSQYFIPPFILKVDQGNNSIRLYLILIYL